jgi:hypothetical protein
MPTKAINIPRNIGDLPPWLENAVTRLNGGLATKYGIDAPAMTILTDLKTNTITSINDVEAASAAAQEKTAIQNVFLHDSRKKFREVFTNIQNHADFDEADMEALGGRVEHAPPDPNEARPVISKVTHLPDMIRFDWIKSHWHGVAIEVSYDGTSWTKEQPDLRSPWEDTRTNQVSGTPEYRYYRFRYIDSDGKQIGHWTEAIKELVEIY